MAKKINHRGPGGHRELLFLRVLCALCGFPKPNSQKTIKSFRLGRTLVK
jgi:hypothetical protein